VSALPVDPIVNSSPAAVHCRGSAEAKGPLCDFCCGNPAHVVTM